MEVLDSANRKFGPGTMGFASSGWKKKATWGMKQENLSPAYTSRWDQLLKVK
jgi:DNA polymerase V